MSGLVADLRFALRSLTRSPGFAAVAILSLGLGIGANTTIFTLINAVFLNPLPVARPAELVAVFTTDAANTGGALQFLQVSRPNYLDLRDENEVLSGLAAYSFPIPASLRLAEEPEQIFVELVTGDYFEVLGVRPHLGRFLGPEDDVRPGGHPLLVLSHRFWQRRFGADPAIVGKSLTVNGTSFTVVGVAPPGFHGVNAIFVPDAWAPTMMYGAVLPRQFHEWFDNRRALLFNTAGRLRPGVSIAEAEANLRAVARRLELAYPEPNAGRSVALLPLTQATIFPGVRDGLVVGGAALMVVVGLVLLIACSNVASLLLARATARRREIAIRVSLGAGRRRLVRQLLTESVLLALAGGGVGLLLAVWGRDWLWSLRPPFLQLNLVDLTLDGRVLAFTGLVAVLTGIVFGLVPALEASRAEVVESLKEETRTAGRTPRRFGLRAALVVGQMTLSVVALVAAGLFLRSLAGAHRIDPGFETENLALLTASPGQAGYESGRLETYYEAARERVLGLPGVRSASWSSNLPLFGGFSRSVFIEGRESEREEDNRGILVMTNIVDPDYFVTVGIPVLRGRGFTRADRAGSVPVAVINETMAERFWPEQDPIGRRFRFYGDEGWHEVVGVARTAKYVTLGEEPQPCAYVPLAQNVVDTMTLNVRAEREPATVLGMVRGELRRLDPAVTLTNAWTIGDVIDQSLWAPRLAAILLSVLGLLALGLAAVGLYGVLSYTVSQRSHEIGLRMALGARRGDVLRLVLGQAMSLVLGGLGLGLLLALAVSRLVAAALYEISATDPLAFASGTALLVVVGLIASLLPAHRASRVDPLAALRYE